MTTTEAREAVHLRAARALLRTGKVALARELAESTADDEVAAALLAIEAELEEAHLGDRDPDRGALEQRRGAIAVGGTPAERWDFRLLELRFAYVEELRADETFSRSSDGRDAPAARLRDEAQGLLASSPDPRRRGWAAFYLGVIADNIFEERRAAPDFYDAALQAATEANDDLLAYQALRHLGDHRQEEGRLSAARECWEASAGYASRAGAVYNTLSQQILLADLARGRGEHQAAELLASEVARWANAIGAVALHAHALTYLEGAQKV